MVASLPQCPAPTVPPHRSARRVLKPAPPRPELDRLIAAGAAIAASGKPPASPKLPSDYKARKDAPIARGVLDYFPKAIAAVAETSRIGSEQHNSGEPMRWAREKSADHADCIVRHLIDRGLFDVDGIRHSAKMAWRALALLQTEIEEWEASQCPSTTDPTTASAVTIRVAGEADARAVRPRTGRRGMNGLSLR